jgi:hypothetical protein
MNLAGKMLVPGFLQNLGPAAEAEEHLLLERGVVTSNQVAHDTEDRITAREVCNRVQVAL